ncbi:MAG: L,D-transpeptidase [Verrucomicrobiota bacterium]
MNVLSRITLSVATIAALLVPGGCATKNEPASATPQNMAIRYGQVTNPSAVKVRVSLANRAVYVYEGDQPRFVAAVAIGKPESPTPTGNFKAFNRLPRKRSNTYGFHVMGEQIRPGKRVDTPPGAKYVGYPMPWWVEFKSGYGFHAGAVWPTPRSKGCLRLHRTIAEDFFHLVRSGTPIYIAPSLPEDGTLGRNVPRPNDYNLPDHPPQVLVTDAPLDRTDILF